MEKGWGRREVVPGVLLVVATAPVQRDDLVLADACLAHRTHLLGRSSLQPLVQARPTAQQRRSKSAVQQRRSNGASG